MAGKEDVMNRRLKIRLIRGTATLALAAICALVAESLSAQGPSRRSRIELRLGVGARVSAGTSASSEGVETTTDVAGMLGAVGFSRWMGETTVGTLSVGVLSVGTETRAGSSGVQTETSLVVPLLVGVRRYLGPGTSDRRFFLSVEAGPITGLQTSTTVGSVVAAEDIVRGAAGIRLGAGVDLWAGSRLAIALLGGYTLMTDFSDPIGGEENHSGPDGTVSIGILFGGGR
jgi:hypothetical protein